MSGTTLGPFSVLRQIFAGPKTEVFLAVRRGPGGFARRVALKRLAGETALDDRALRALLDEARLQGRVQHPNVVAVDDLVIIDGTYYVVMEWVDGVNLAELIGRCADLGGSVPFQHALFIASEVALGLHAAHTCVDDGGKPLYLVHRDVCPRNILIGWNGAVRLTDFGIAHAARRHSDTRANAIKGTPAYLSPEQASGAVVDARSDVFSLGLCLYEMLTGTRPFRGNSVEELVRAARDGHIAPATTLNPQLPPSVEDLLGSLLARLPRQRLEDARAAARAMCRFLHHGDPDYSPADLPGFLAGVFPNETSQTEDDTNTDIYRRVT